jgi:hypothetical protein
MDRSPGDGHIFVEGPSRLVQVEANGTGRKNHVARGTRVRPLLPGQDLDYVHGLKIQKNPKEKKLLSTYVVMNDVWNMK